jgi:predicted RNA-binding protein with PIN domain
MTTIIDGNNLLGHYYSGAGIRDAGNRAELVGKLVEFQRITRTRLILVFDGKPPEGENSLIIDPKLTIIFPEPGESADIVIAEKILRQTDKRRFFVVSSDRAIRDLARSRGLQDIPADKFARELDRTLKKSVKREEMSKNERRPSPLEVRLWSEAFREKK